MIYIMFSCKTVLFWAFFMIGNENATDSQMGKLKYIVIPTKVGIRITNGYFRIPPPTPVLRWAGCWSK